MNDPSSDADALLDEAVAAMRRMPAPERPPDAQVLEGLARTKTSRLSSISHTLYTRIRHMHPALRYTIVAAVVSALLLLGFGPRSETLLLGDVVEAVAKHKTVRFESKNEMPAERREGPQSQQFNRNQHARTISHTVYSTLDTMHSRHENPNGQLTILDKGKGVFLNVWPAEKRALISKLPGRQSANGLLEILDELEKDKRTTSSVEQLDGSDVVVYRLTKDKVKSTIWADGKTKLPVRVEMEMLQGPRQKTSMTQFVWDPPIADPAKFFSVEPPEGYTVNTNKAFKEAPPNQKRGPRFDCEIPTKKGN
jgi:outer membrane lipoprotein-sorting protein